MIFICKSKDFLSNKRWIKQLLNRTKLSKMVVLSGILRIIRIILKIDIIYSKYFSSRNFFIRDFKDYKDYSL